jgi:hypothetical protein
MGIGQETALSRLFALETGPFDSIEKGLYDAYDAKEACAEFVPDVGREWDAMILVEGKPPAEVPKNIREIIEALYKAHPRSPFLKPDSAEPEGWQATLADFSSWVLTRMEGPMNALGRPNRGRD